MKGKKSDSNTTVLGSSGAVMEHLWDIIEAVMRQWWDSNGTAAGQLYDSNGADCQWSYCLGGPQAFKGNPQLHWRSVIRMLLSS